MRACFQIELGTNQIMILFPFLQNLQVARHLGTSKLLQVRKKKNEKENPENCQISLDDHDNTFQIKYINILYLLIIQIQS